MDLIDRQAAIDALCNDFCGGHHDCKHYPDCGNLESIQALPAAQPEWKKGKWINNSPVTMKCDQCGYVIKDWRWAELNFCANCGADMRGEQDE